MCQKISLAFCISVIPTLQMGPEQLSEREALQLAKDSCCSPKSELNLDDTEVIHEASK